MTVFAGINGAGKSTLFHYQAQQGIPNLGERICPDEILQDMNGDWHNYRDVGESARISIRKLHWCVNNQQSFNWETTIVTGFMVEFLKRAKKQGFITNLNFIGVGDVNQSIERVKSRVESGGHGVPEELIRHRHKLQFNNIREVLEVVDYAKFYDNQDNMKVVGIYANNKLLYADPEVDWMQQINRNVQRAQLASKTYSIKL